MALLVLAGSVKRDFFSDTLCTMNCLLKQRFRYIHFVYISTYVKNIFKVDPE